MVLLFGVELLKRIKLNWELSRIRLLKLLLVLSIRKCHSFVCGTNVLKLPDLFRHKIAKLIHKLLRNNHPPNFFKFFIKTNKIHNRTTRLASNEHALYIPRYKTEKLQRSFKYQGVKVWNSLPDSLKKLQANANQQICRKLGS